MIEPEPRTRGGAEVKRNLLGGRRFHAANVGAPARKGIGGATIFVDVTIEVGGSPIWRQCV
jgi:hypothetical protein